jgi:hypothetical protein
MTMVVVVVTETKSHALHFNVLGFVIVEINVALHILVAHLGNLVVAVIDADSMIVMVDTIVIITIMLLTEAVMMVMIDVEVMINHHHQGVREGMVIMMAIT